MPTGHYSRPTVTERFQAKFLPEPNSGCWLWSGAVFHNGYGVFRKDGRAEYAHRAAYELFVGPIPDHLDLDHLYRNRACVNPDHLEPVTRRVNLLRGNTITAANAKNTHCLHGHPLDQDNAYINKRGSRSCQTCRIAADKRRQERKRHAVKS